MADETEVVVQETPNSDIIPDTAAKAEAAATDDTDGESNEDSADSDGDDATANPKKPRGFSKRIKELTREKYDNQRAAERAREEAEYWRNQAIQKGGPAQIPTASQGKPTLEQFGYDQEQYFEALADWKADQRIQTWQQEQSKQTEQQRAVEAARGFQARQAEFIQSAPDYMEVAINNPLADRYSDAMIEVIRDSDIGPQLAYELGQDLDETARILALPAAKQAYALGRIEARLALEAAAPGNVQQAPPPKTTTRAPAPPAQLPSKGASVPTGYHPGMSMAEYNAWREKGGGSKKTS